LSSTNELQNLSYTTASRSLGITSGTGVTLPLFSTTDAGLVPLSGGGTTNFLRADGSWAAPAGLAYAAGTGLSLNSNTFFNTGDLSSTNEIQNLSYAAGTRALGITSGTGITLPIFTAANAGLVTGSGGGSTNFLRADGTWAAPPGANYAAGTGLTLTTGTFFHAAHTGDARGTTSLIVVALQGRSVSSSAPSNNQVLKWNGSNWAPANDANTTYSAGTGLSLTGSTFANIGDLSSTNEIQNLSYASGSRALGITSGTGVTLPIFTAANAGLVTGSGGGTTNFLRADGTWAAPTAGVYAAGTGLSLNSNTFINIGDLSTTNELQNLTYAAGTRALGITSGTGITLPIFTAANAGLVSGSGGGTTRFLRADGSWIVPVGTTYSAGAGLTLSTGTFAHTSHTGDAIGSTSLTVIALQGRSIYSAAPSDQNLLTWVNANSRWEPKSLTVMQDANSDTKVELERTSNDNKIRFSTNGSDRVIIDNTGKVGVNTTSPTSFMDINGSIGTRVVTTGNSNINLDATHTVILADNTVGININLPDATTCQGRIYMIKNIGGNIVSVRPFTGQTLEGSTLPTSINNTGDAIIIVSYGNGWYIFAAKP
jgi:hypothetical protein